MTDNDEGPKVKPVIPMTGFTGTVVGFGTTNSNNNDNDTPNTGVIILPKPPPKEEKVDNFPHPAGGKKVQDMGEAPEVPLPMAFQVLSDLHLEEQNQFSSYDRDIMPKAQFLVLAGDIANCIDSDNPDRYFSWLSRHTEKFERIFLVMGNGEPKGKGPNENVNGRDTAISLLRNWAQHDNMKGKLTFMENNSFDLLGTHGLDVIVLGCTLWSRIRESQSATAGRGDRRSIRGWGPGPHKHNEVFENSYKWLRDQVSEIRSGDRKSARILVVTHHAPCFGTSVPEKDKLGEEWSAYQNDILGGEGVEGLRMGDVWVFGHTHFCCDFLKDEVRVYANQRGRLGWTARYKEDKIISI